MRKKLLLVVFIIASSSVYASECYDYGLKEVQRDGELFEFYSFSYSYKVYHGDPRYCYDNRYNRCYHFEYRTLEFEDYDNYRNAWNKIGCKYTQPRPQLQRITN